MGDCQTEESVQNEMGLPSLTALEDVLLSQLTFKVTR